MNTSQPLSTLSTSPTTLFTLWLSYRVIHPEVSTAHPSRPLSSLLSFPDLSLPQSIRKLNSLLLFVTASVRCGVVFCAQHSSFRRPSLRVGLWTDWGHAIPLHLRPGVSGAQYKDSRREHDVFLLQWISNAAGPYCLLRSFMEDVSLDYHGSCNSDLPLLEVSSAKISFAERLSFWVVPVKRLHMTFRLSLQ